jgi:bifunctional non-homologous end joining protein LigD
MRIPRIPGRYPAPRLAPAVRALQVLFIHMPKPATSPMPRTVQLMLCTLVAEPFDNPGWIFEPKLDGLRVLCRFDGKRATLISRNDKPQDFQFPDIGEALQKSLTKPALLDGEIVCLDERGQSSFRALQQRFHLTDAGVVASRVKEFPAYLYVFDLLYYDRFDARPLSLHERKKLLGKAVKWSDRIRNTPATPGRGTALLRQTCRAAGEGIVGKNIHTPYVGGRSEGWVKIKCAMRQEFVIGGFTDPQRSRVGLGALLVGYYDDGKFTYAGKVGTGFNTDLLLDLRKRLDRIEQADSPFDKGKPPRGDHVHWVKPRLVGEFGFAEWTQNDLLRQPRFEGLRTDKKPTLVRRERAKMVAI